MAAFLTTLSAGLGLGCVYGLVALSYNVLFRASGVFSFAQGQLLMLGSMGAYEATVPHHVPLVLGFVLTCLGVAFVSVAVERVAVAPVLAARAHLWVLSTLGAGLFITAIAQRIWGTIPFQIDAYISKSHVTLFGAVIETAYLLPLIALVVLTVGLWQLELRTRFGKAIRALALNRSAAIRAGVPTSRYSVIAFAIGGAVAGATGFLTAPILYADPNAGFSIGVLSFAAWAIGGFGSNFGAAIGGLVVGVTQQMSSFYWSTRIPDIVVFVTLLIVMLVRPTGLFGKLAARQV